MKTGIVQPHSELVWCSLWNFVGEGPYTLAAKMLNANNLKPRDRTNR
jgi:hypothetical protein